MNKMLLLAMLVVATSINLPANAQQKYGRRLPPTSMDSFVRQAAGNADLIYGDEGVVDIPPYDYFDPIHRINAGIYDTRNRGLTTGHGSYLPDAWGGDEFTGNEWSRSGAKSNPTRTPFYAQDRPSQGGDPASNDPTKNPTSAPPPSRGRGDFQIDRGGNGNDDTVIRSPGMNNPRRFHGG